MTHFAPDSSDEYPAVPESLSAHDISQVPDSRDTKTTPGKPELLAPAGNWPALLAALANGADAIYLGAGDFNARRNAANFSVQELREVCDLVHLAGARLYLTLNTAILQSEFDAALELARQAWYSGADAAIVADLGLLACLARELPELKLHASTQLSTHNASAIRWLAAQGVSRVTLARELAVEQIASLAAVAASLNVSVEVFAHGAICFCYSGQCLLSSLVGRRSANRGFCAQPCRLPYQLIDTSTGRRIKTTGDRLLSPLDLNAIEFIPALRAAGVAALKIEGRMKNADYVAAVTAAYREVLDHGQLSGERRESLQLAYSRGYSTAYLSGSSDNRLMSYQRSAGRSADSGEPSPVWNTSALFQANQGLVALNARVRVRLGEPLSLSFVHAQNQLEAGVTGNVVEPARSRALTREDLIEHIGRVGGTPFTVSSWEIELDDGAGVGFSALHDLRRQALESLTKLMLEPWHSRRLRRSALRDCEQLPAVRRGSPFVATLVRDASAAKTAAKAGAKRNYLHCLSFSSEAPDYAARPNMSFCAERSVVAESSGTAIIPKRHPEIAEGKAQDLAEQSVVAESSGTASSRLDSATTGFALAQNDIRGAFSRKLPLFWLPTITRDDELQSIFAQLECGFRENPNAAIVVNNSGQMELASKHGFAFEIGPGLGCYNQAALELFARSGAQRVWLGPELSMRDLELLAPNAPLALGIVVSGAQELIVSEHCILQAQGDCNKQCASCARRKSPRLLEDRLGYRFPVRTDNAGRSHLYNAVPLDIVSNLPDLLALGITGFLVDCTLLNSAQTSEAVTRATRACKLAANGTGKLPKREATTTGHLFRGVL
jgi:putative protease